VCWCWQVACHVCPASCCDVVSRKLLLVLLVNVTGYASRPASKLLSTNEQLSAVCVD
jgi:hypothetical protein